MSTRFFWPNSLAICTALFTAASAVAGTPLTLTGTTTLRPSGELIFRTADSDYLINAQSLSRENRRVIDTRARDQRITITIDSDAILRKERTPGGIRPDCTELPLAYEEIAHLAKSSAIQSINDFLTSIPAGTLQSFTLAHESQSAQREGVSATYPRVIRTDSTGKLTIAYNCNPQAPTYGTVEVIRHDETKGENKFSRFDFRPQSRRVVEDPTDPDCASCHHGSSQQSPLHHNWKQYPIWNGLYGSNDGRLEGTELENFRRFKNLRQNDPCYSSLPWPSAPAPELLSDYPYFASRDKRKLINFSNFTIGVKYASIQADILANRIAQQARFQATRANFFLSHFCAQKSSPIQAQLSQANQFLHQSAEDLLVEDYFKQLGLGTEDLNLDPQENKTQGHWAVGTSATSQNLSGLLARKLYERYRATQPTLSGIASMNEPYRLDDFAHPASSLQSPDDRYQCMADAFLTHLQIGTDLVAERRVRADQRRVCEALIPLAARERQEGMNGIPAAAAPVQAGAITPLTTEEKILRGRAYFQNVCMRCHNQAVEGPGISRDHIQRVRSQIKTGAMPRGRSISAEDKESLLTYIDSLLNH